MYKRIIMLVSVAMVVFLCTFNVYAANSGSVSNYSTVNNLFQINNSNVTTQLTITAFTPTIEEPAYSSIYNYEFTLLGRIVVHNPGNKSLVFTNDNYFDYYILPSNSAGNSEQDGSGTNYYWHIKDVNYIGGQLNIGRVDSNGFVRFYPYDDDLNGHTSVIVIPAYSNYECYFEITYTSVMPSYARNYSPTFNGNSVYLYTTGRTYNGNLQDVKPNYYFYIPDIYNELVLMYGTEQAQLSALQQILASYNTNVPQSQTVTNNSSALETQSNNVHTQESSYYTQTNTALGNTGLSNFSFSPNVVGGLGKVKDQFTYVWNKLGDYRDVYLFSMTLAIALMIIRHVRPIRRKKEE